MALNGEKLDFTVTGGRLPPSSRRKRSTRESKTKTSKTDIRRPINSRPNSVPTSSSWDENNPLSIQSTSIPLSSRSKYSSSDIYSTNTPLYGNYSARRPKTSSKGYMSDEFPRRMPPSNAANGVNNKESPPSRPTRAMYNSSSVQSEQRSSSSYARKHNETVQYSRSSGIVLESSDNDSIPEVLDESVDKLSSEIDSILHDINSGLIVSSSIADESFVSRCTKNEHKDGTACNSHSDELLLLKQDTVKKSLQSPIASSEKHNDSRSSLPAAALDMEEKAAITIQEWYRECRNGRLREELNRVESFSSTTDHLNTTRDTSAAAIKIQRWFRRRCHQRQMQREKELQAILQEKRKEKDKSRRKERKSISTEEEKEQRRALKMQAARKQAIEALKKKREEEKNSREMIVQQEMKMLEETGVVKRLKSTGKTNGKSKPKVAANFSLKTEHVVEFQSDPKPSQSNSSHFPSQSASLVSQSQSISKSESQPACTLNSDSQSVPRVHSDTTVYQKSHEEEQPSSIQNGQIDNENVKLKRTEVQVSSSTESNAVDDFFKAGPRRVTPRRRSSPAKESDPSQKPSSKTVNDIFAALKELEEDHPPLPGVNPTSPTYLSKTNLELLNQTSLKTTNVSDQKLQNILSYLDDIQKSEQLSSTGGGEVTSQKSAIDVNVPAKVQEDLSHQLEAASVVANDVTTTIVTQRMELENKNRTIEMLQKALNQQRELTVYHAKEMEKESQKRLEIQKQEYESTVSRHQCFIDQLIDDKKVLSDKCEALVNEIKDKDKKHKTKVTTMEDTHAAEIEKIKQTSVTAEKMRREKWRADETQRIKEATVKSLEPEIQRIIARGKAEIQKLKAMHEAELLQADERASRRFLQQTEDLRTQFAQEKEMACQHERELARQKYEQLAEQEEKSYQQLRKKLYSEVQLEKDRLADETKTLREEISKEVKEMKDFHQLELAKIKLEHESSTAETQRRHMSELKDVKERANIEKQAWEENYIRKQDAVLLTKEREMRERLRRERDMEIETVIQKLEAETAAAREECERTSESRVKRIREKYETELKEVEKSERCTLEKYNTMKSQLTEYEGDIIRLRSQLRQREEEVERVNEIATKLTKERDRVADVVRQEFADRLVAVEDENRHMKLEISELKSRHTLELSRKEREKERELEDVHQRVKEALAKKEDNYKSLRSQHEAALKRADHLEMLLEQQRKQLLKR